MRKRILCLMILMSMVLTAMPALADQPKPIEVIPYEQLPEPIDGQHHYRTTWAIPTVSCWSRWTPAPTA